MSQHLIILIDTYTYISDLRGPLIIELLKSIWARALKPQCDSVVLSLSQPYPTIWKLQLAVNLIPSLFTTNNSFLVRNSQHSPLHISDI